MRGPDTPPVRVQARTRSVPHGGHEMVERTPPQPVGERSSYLELAALRTAVGCARLFTTFTVRAWRLIDLLEPSELLVSELVTNAVKATGTAVARPRWSELGQLPLIGVRLRATDRRLAIDVWDEDVNPPVLRRPSLDAEVGRGLVLVDALSSRWGCTHPRAGGKVVWCELDVHGGR